MALSSFRSGLKHVAWTNRTMKRGRKTWQREKTFVIALDFPGCCFDKIHCDMTLRMIKKQEVVKMIKKHIYTQRERERARDEGVGSITPPHSYQTQHLGAGAVPEQPWNRDGPDWHHLMLPPTYQNILSQPITVLVHNITAEVILYSLWNKVRLTSYASKKWSVLQAYICAMRCWFLFSTWIMNTFNQKTESNQRTSIFSVQGLTLLNWMWECQTINRD